MWKDDTKSTKLDFWIWFGTLHTQNWAKWSHNIIQHDTITTTYISFIITVDKNITYVAEFPCIFVGLSIVAIKE